MRRGDQAVIDTKGQRSPIVASHDVYKNFRYHTTYIIA
jgi:hypothetical protein